MGWISDPNSTSDTKDNHRCNLPTLAWKNGNREIKGVHPNIGSVWQCDTCDKYYVAKLHKVEDVYNPRKWLCRKWVLVRWYHIGAQRKITAYVRKES